MKKILLSLLAVGLVAVSCQKYDQSDEIGDLETRLKAAEAGISTNAIEIASAKTARTNIQAAQALLQDAIDAEDAIVQAAIASATSAILKGNADLLALTAALDASDVKSSELETEIEGLKEAIEDLEEQLSALGVEVDDLDDAPSDLQYTGWIPTLVAQTSGFTQTQSATLSGIVQPNGGQSRDILVTLTSTSTITETSTELAEDVDINEDKDHADSLTRTFVRSIYTGVVSGTNENIGNFPVDGTPTAWRVHASGKGSAVVPFHTLSDETQHILKELGFVENGTNEKSKVRNYVRQRTPQEYRDGHDGLVDLGQIVYHFWRDSGAQRVTKWDFGGQPQHQKDSFTGFRDVVDYIYEISTITQPEMDEMWTRGFVRQQNLDEELFFVHAESNVSILFSFDDKNIYVINHDGTVDTHELSTVPRRQAILYAYKRAGVTY